MLLGLGGRAETQATLGHGRFEMSFVHHEKRDLCVWSEKEIWETNF